MGKSLFNIQDFARQFLNTPPYMSLNMLDAITYAYPDVGLFSDAMAKMTKPQNTVRFDQVKLHAFAARHGKDPSDIIDMLAKQILGGNPSPQVAALQAGPYDDFLAYHVKDPRDYGQDFIVVESHAAGHYHHKLEYELGTAEFVVPGGITAVMRRGVRSGRVFLCVGSEYINPDVIDDILNYARGNVRIVRCAHEQGDQEMPRVTAARIWWDEASGTYAMATPWNDDFIMWFKLIGKQHKSWDPDNKLWYVSPQVVDEVRKKVEQIFGSCHFVPPNNNAPRQQVVMGGDLFTKFCRLVGPDALAKAYRHAAAELHPDRGGDAAKMSDLNQMFAQIKSALK